MDDETFATALRVARDRMGLTREEFGEGLKVSGTTIQKWEGGEVFPKPARWRAIMDFCGLDPSLYKDYSPTIDNSDQATASYSSVAASGGSTVSIKPDINLHEPMIPTELSAKEWEALQALRFFGDIAFDAAILFKRYGSLARLEMCVNDLMEERNKTGNLPTRLYVYLPNETVKTPNSRFCSPCHDPLWYVSLPKTNK